MDRTRRRKAGVPKEVTFKTRLACANVRRILCVRKCGLACSLVQAASTPEPLRERFPGLRHTRTHRQSVDIAERSVGSLLPMALWYPILPASALQAGSAHDAQYTPAPNRATAPSGPGIAVSSKRRGRSIHRRNIGTGRQLRSYGAAHVTAVAARAAATPSETAWPLAARASVAKSAAAVSILQPGPAIAAPSKLVIDGEAVRVASTDDANEIDMAANAGRTLRQESYRLQPLHVA
jgi:hypothetical protein